MNQTILMALVATLGTWSVTALGAAMVVFFKNPNPKALNLMLGFAAGVMVAASFWSLLEPAIARAEAASAFPAYLVVTAGFLCGALFMWASDKIVTYARGRANCTLGRPDERLNRIIMLILSITIHNIPEGLAVGVAFGMLQGSHYSLESLMGGRLFLFHCAVRVIPAKKAFYWGRLLVWLNRPLVYLAHGWWCISRRCCRLRFRLQPGQ